MNTELLNKLEEKTQEFRALFAEFDEIKSSLDEHSYDRLIAIKEKMSALQKEIVEIKHKLND